MLASWYDRQGPAAEVLQIGELPDPEPGPGEVRVRVRVSGVNPGDIKKRARWRRAGRKRLGFSHLSHISSMSVSNATAALLTEDQPAKSAGEPRPEGQLRRNAPDL